MPSRALSDWLGRQRQELDRFEEIHRSVAGTGPGRRYAMEQLNFAYLVLIASQFQGFCRALHSEAADFIVAKTQPPTTQALMSALFTSGRKLDQGNANPASLGADFGRFGLAFWEEVKRKGGGNGERQRWIERMNIWRNKIAHQNFAYDEKELALVGDVKRPQLREARACRNACLGLARSIDAVVKTHLEGLAGTAPW